MIFGLFRDKQLDGFSRGLARELVVRIPPATLAAEQELNSKPKTAAIVKASQYAFMKVQNYCHDHKIGLLKKAQLSKIFQDELVLQGYPQDFVKELTLAVAQHLIKL